MFAPSLSIPKSYYVPSSAFGYRQVLPIYAAYFIGIFLIQLSSPLLIILGLFLSGVSAYRMTFILHDCSHRTLFREKMENEFWGWLTGFFIFVLFPNYRQTHWVHHTDLWKASDPQAEDYRNFSPSTRGLWFHLFGPFVFANLLIKLGRFTQTKKNKSASTEANLTKAQVIFGFLGILVIQAAVFWLVSAGMQFPERYLFLCVFVASLGLGLSRIRSYLEHGILDSHDPAHPEGKVIRTHRGTWLERRIFCAAAFNFHYEHHRWPQVPSKYLELIHNTITRQHLDMGKAAPSYWSSFKRLIKSKMNSYQLEECPFDHSLPLLETEEVSCGLCHDTKYEIYSYSYDYEYESSRNRWRFVKCLRCANVYLNPRPKASDLGVIYPPHYYSYHYDKAFNWLARTGKQILDRQTFKKIRATAGVQIQNYLDIGCGNGRYMLQLAKDGVAPGNIYGVELDPRPLNSLEKRGFKVFSKPFEEITDLPEKKFQLITLFSVLEHVADPRSTMQRAHSLLSDDGVLVFEVPNIKSLNGKIFQNGFWGAFHTPRHWNLFSLETITQIAEELGFSVRAQKRTTGHTFWLLSFRHFISFGLKKRALGDRLLPDRFLLGVVMATFIDKCRAFFNQETDNMIIFLQKNNQSSEMDSVKFLEAKNG